MNMTTLKLIGGMALLLAIAATAQAQTTIYYDFEDDPLGANPPNLPDTTWSQGGSSVIVQNSNQNLDSPNSESTKYIRVQNGATTTQMSIDNPQAFQQISFYWGKGECGSGTQSCGFIVATDTGFAWSFEQRADTAVMVNGGQFGNCAELSRLLVVISINWNFSPDPAATINFYDTTVTTNYNPCATIANKISAVVDPTQITSLYWTSPVGNPTMHYIDNLLLSVTPQTTTPPLGLEGEVTGWDGFVSDFTLQWPISPDDPDQDESAWVYLFYIDTGSGFTNQGYAPGDTPRNGHYSVDFGINHPGPAQIKIRAVGYGDGGFTCTITLDFDNVGDTSSCGDPTGGGAVPTAPAGLTMTVHTWNGMTGGAAFSDLEAYFPLSSNDPDGSDPGFEYYIYYDTGSGYGAGTRIDQFDTVTGDGFVSTGDGPYNIGIGGFAGVMKAKVAGKGGVFGPFSCEVTFDTTSVGSQVSCGDLTPITPLAPAGLQIVVHTWNGLTGGESFSDLEARFLPSGNDPGGLDPAWNYHIFYNTGSGFVDGGAMVGLTAVGDVLSTGTDPYNIGIGTSSTFSVKIRAVNQGVPGTFSCTVSVNPTAIGAVVGCGTLATGGGIGGGGGGLGGTGDEPPAIVSYFADKYGPTMAALIVIVVMAGIGYAMMGPFGAVIFGVIGVAAAVAWAYANVFLLTLIGIVAVAALVMGFRLRSGSGE